MGKLTVLALGLWAMLSGPLWAQGKPGPVLVELFTSQGCSSCPPADAYLAKLAQRSDVLALSFHVDYWDYIGWKDVFAHPKFTARQYAYASADKTRMVYTPQMVIAGRDAVVGSKFDQIARLIAKHRQQPAAVQLQLARKGNQLLIAAPASPSNPEMMVQLVRYIKAQKIRIKRGENAGREINYHNIVTEWDVLDHWDGSKPLRLSVPFTGDQPALVVVQTADYGPVLAAARLR
ncbi:MAG: DUF1223 domain-containing protein [Rhodobacterales bacterium]|nr:MAG: DUF1223 domain-containing protein [Rhodobacterales bacterium]